MFWLAPGEDFLAAWVPYQGFAATRNDVLITDYALLSGTSMASPHVIGIAAMLKSLHGNWSPAAITSAIITAADITDNTGVLIIDMTRGTAATPLDYGAGHVNKNKAMDQGLAYDIGLDDYMNFLCGVNYTESVITRKPERSCTRTDLDLNYSSLTVILETNSSSQVFWRILTNVGDHPRCYQAVITEPKGMKVVVEPQVLTFKGKNS